MMIARPTLAGLLMLGVLTSGCATWGESREECYFRVYEETGSTFKAEDRCRGKMSQF
jgi:hypothetical protein